MFIKSLHVAQEKKPNSPLTVQGKIWQKDGIYMEPEAIPAFSLNKISLFDVPRISIKNMGSCLEYVSLS